MTKKASIDEHDVFINFRGELRDNFVSHLESALFRAGVKVYTDKQERMGKELNIFFQKIKDSSIAIAVISSLYTESKWCLDELAEITKCAKEGTLEVFPVFYKVKVKSLKTVKKQKDNFGLNFQKSVKKEPSKRKVWANALKYVTGIKGASVKETNCDEGTVIKKIIKDVQIKLDELSTDQGTKSPRDKPIKLSQDKSGEPQSSSSAKASPLFGLDTRLEQLKEKLDFESDKVTRFIGVVGMPGIGKTTLAKKLLDECGCRFLHTMFLDDVRQKSKSLGFYRMQQDLLSGLQKSYNGGKEHKDTSFSLESLKAELSESKVFIVLDDVSDKTQIDEILYDRKWIKEGSRVVITTCNKSVVKGMVDETYIVPGLSDNDALKYFEEHAFSDSCDPSFKKLARKVVDYSRGHPLALKELGRELHMKDESYWKSKLETLAKSPISNSIQQVLKVPYDRLDKHHKDLFLDVACFFRFENEYRVKSLLDYSVDENESKIRDLDDKFLINICGGKLEINDLMYTFAMGLESVSRRRLFNHGEIITFLLNKAETTEVRGIFLDTSVVKRMSLGKDTFKYMKSLRYLKFYNSSCPRECNAECNLLFGNGLDFTLEEIRYLHWLKFPLENLPQNFEPKNLIDLKLPYSKIKKIWEGQKDTSKLKWLDLNHSSELCTLSGLSLARKLQSMNLEGCTRLETIHKELQNMESLVFLNLRGCTSLKSLSRMNLISLKTLILSGCSNLKNFNMISKNLEELYLDGTAIKSLPSKIGELQRLVLLTLKDCRKLSSLPDSIGNLIALGKLVLSGCSSLENFPEIKENMKHLKTLLLDGTAIKELPYLLHRFCDNQPQTSSAPQDTYRLSSVQRLCLSGNSFKSLPNDIRYLYGLKWFDLKYCKQLKSLPMLPPNLHCLDAHGCISLTDIESPLALLLEETEQSQSSFIFTNCDKLDQVAKNRIVSYVREKIQLMSDELTHHQDKGSAVMLIKVCYPSWQLPVWFNHRTVGSELTQKLPRHWNEDELTGIALCAVVSFEDCLAQNSPLLVKCTSEFKEGDEPLIQFSSILGGWTEHSSDRPKDINKPSSHVFIGYTSLSEIKKHDRGSGCTDMEASFKFQVTDGTKQITNCEVLKCGFTLIYAPIKHVHSLCTEKHSENGKIIYGSNNMSEERHLKISSGSTSVSLVALETDSESIEKVTRHAQNITWEPTVVEAPSRTNGEVLVVAGSMPPDSLEEAGVVDEESQNNGESNEGVETSSCVSSENTVNSGNDVSLSNGLNNFCELLEKPIRLICVVMSIYAVATFALRKEKRKR